MQPQKKVNLFKKKKKMDASQDLFYLLVPNQMLCASLHAYTLDPFDGLIGCLATQIGI
jgi:hypothetical protein